MALSMDIHRQQEGLTGEAAAGAHARDLDVQAMYGSSTCGTAMMRALAQFFACARPPSKEVAEAVHREAHRLVANESIEVKEGA
jgi:hypothetical protein